MKEFQTEVEAADALKEAFGKLQKEIGQFYKREKKRNKKPEFIAPFLLLKFRFLLKRINLISFKIWITITDILSSFIHKNKIGS